MPCWRCAAVPPPSGTLPPEVIAWPPMSGSCSTTMTDAPASRATIAAVMPVAPEPITTTSASACHAAGGGGATNAISVRAGAPPNSSAISFLPGLLCCGSSGTTAG